MNYGNRSIRPEYKSIQHSFDNRTCEEGYQIDVTSILDHWFIVNCSPYTPLGIAFIVLWLCLLNYMLFSTTIEYLDLSLHRLFEKFRLSSPLVNAMFFSLSNSASDIMLSYIGVQRDAQDLTIGMVIGGALFVLTVVIGIVLLYQKEQRMMINRRPFVRDMISIMIASSFLLFLWWSNTITLAESVIMIGIYVLYLLVIIVGRYIYQKQKEKRRMDLGIVEEPDELLEMGFDDNILTDVTYFGGYGMRDNIELSFYQESNTNFGEIKDFFKRMIDQIRWTEKNAFQKIVYVFVSPTILIRKLTIPQNNEDYFSEVLFIFCGLFNPILFAVGLKSISDNLAIGEFLIPVWSIAVGSGIILALLSKLLCVYIKKFPSLFIIVCVWSFISSIMWIYIIGIELVSLLSLICWLTSWTPSVMGVLLFSWGNGAASLLSAINLAKQGLFMTALTTAWAQPILTMMGGFGLACLVKILTLPKDNWMIVFDESDNPTLFAVCAILLVTVLSLIGVPISKFQIGKRFSAILFVIYSIFVIMAILTETHVIFSSQIAEQ
eukprot:TRINITY_DN11245_c0_g1_i1.p1 TRINITY_DN11245_c0_g1~~TRINITY_DN11245_c0_g1_i1.p1  ORF type:complete len:549 (-),score=63.20 TRINITY_DN11245_c0_g1_i1:41-1687(-)